MLFFIIFMSILAVSYGYVGWRIIIPAGLPLWGNIAAWGLLAIFIILPPLPWFLRPAGVDKSIVNIIAWIGYIGLGFMALLIFSTFFRDLGWMLGSGFQKVLSFIKPQSASLAPMDPARRQFIIQAVNLGILGFSAAAVGYGIYEARRKPSVVELDVPIAHLPPEFEGFRIAQFSDMHIGPTITRNFVETVVQTIEELKADMIAFTGDLVDGSVDDLAFDVEPIARLQAPYGKFFITGNHEYYSGVMPWLKHVKSLGFDPLIDEHRLIERGRAKMTIAGVTDYSAKQFLKTHESDPHKAIAGAPQNGVKILLAHQPQNIREASKAGFDLQLSGHTHGGQFIPWNFMTRLAQPYIAGLHRHKNTWIYVNRGTGYWGPPLRLGIKSEITLLTLTRKVETRI